MPFVISEKCYFRLMSFRSISDIALATRKSPFRIPFHFPSTLFRISKFNYDFLQLSTSSILDDQTIVKFLTRSPQYSKARIYMI